MHSAPPVLVPVGRFVWGRPQAVLLALVVAALSALLAWVAGLSVPGQWILLLVWLVVLVLVGQIAPLEALPPGELGWDGEAWSFRGSDGASEAVQVQVGWDAGRAMLLRLSTRGDGWRLDRYTWLQASQMPLQWHGLRCALYARDIL